MLMPVGLKGDERKNYVTKNAKKLRAVESKPRNAHPGLRIAGGAGVEKKKGK